MYFGDIQTFDSEAEISKGTGSKVARSDYPMVIFIAGI